MKLDHKGFTLIELTISLVLLTVVLLFVMNFLNIIKSDESNASFDNQIIVNTSLISENINRDVKEAGGISSSNCSKNVNSPTETSCNMVLKDGSVRIFEISSDKKTLYYKDDEGNIIYSRNAISGYPFSIVYTEGNQILLVTIRQGNEYPIEIVSKK